MMSIFKAFYRISNPVFVVAVEAFEVSFVLGGDSMKSRPKSSVNSVESKQTHVINFFPDVTSIQNVLDKFGGENRDSCFFLEERNK